MTDSETRSNTNPTLIDTETRSKNTTTLFSNLKVYNTDLK